MNRPDSTAKNVPKIAELKLSSCGLEVATPEKIAIAEQHFFKSCGLAIADSKKS
jgi:ATP phosphoribosyltransferase